MHQTASQISLLLPFLHEFIKSGADHKFLDLDSQQPLYEVCSRGSLQGPRLILDYGANVEHADVMGITALHSAAMKGNLQMSQVRNYQIADRKGSMFEEARSEAPNRVSVMHVQTILSNELNIGSLLLISKSTTEVNSKL